MKRYICNDGYGNAVAVEDPEGPWVRFADVAPLVAALDEAETALVQAGVDLAHGGGGENDPDKVAGRVFAASRAAEAALAAWGGDE